MLSFEKPKKKIVTKRQYLARMGDKAGTSLFAMILLFFCGLGMLMTLIALIASLFGGILVHGLFPLLVLVFVLAMLGSGSWYLGYLGRRTLKEARQIDTGIPLTRNNIGELEAEESLVRASEQPLLPQQHVLLRPAAGMEETSAEHLLRPS